MKCHEFQDRLQDWFDGELDTAQAHRLQAHAEACPGCRVQVREFRVLRAALADLPAPALSAEQSERLLARTRPRRRTWPAAAAAAAAAAGLAAVVLPFADRDPLGPTAGEVAAREEAADVTLSLHEPRTVHLALASQRKLENAVMELELPPGVALQGRPGQRVLRWQTDIAAGENRLSLPLVAHEAGIQELVARLEHEGRSRELRLRLDVRASDPTRPTRSGLYRGPGPQRA